MINENKINELLRFTYVFGLVLYIKNFVWLIIDLLADEVPEMWGKTVLFLVLFSLLTIKSVKSFKQLILFIILAILLYVALAVLFASIQTFLI